MEDAAVSVYMEIEGEKMQSTLLDRKREPRRASERVLLKSLFLSTVNYILDRGASSIL